MKSRILGIVSGLLLSMPVCAESPLAQGVYGLSGSASYTQTESDGETLTSWSIAPSLRYFVSNKVAVGGTVSYSSMERGSIDWEVTGVGPLVRYYFVDEGMRPFVELQYLVEDQEATSSSSSTYGIEQDSTSTSVALGLDLFLAKNVALEPVVQYRHRDVDVTGGPSTRESVSEDEVTVQLGISVFIY